jgi:hypothetical protein
VKTIAAVPEIVTREAVCDLIRSLGIDPNHLRSMSFEHKAIVAEVYSLNPDGQRFIRNGNEAATDSIVIPVVDR